MGLKNFALFIGVVRGDKIELRDYDNINDLADDTQILLFETSPTQERKLRELADARLFELREGGIELEKIVEDDVELYTTTNHRSFKPLEPHRRAKIGTDENGKKVIVFRKGRLHATNKKARIRKS